MRARTRRQRQSLRIGLESESGFPNKMAFFEMKLGSGCPLRTPVFNKHCLLFQKSTMKKSRIIKRTSVPFETSVSFGSPYSAFISLFRSLKVVSESTMLHSKCDVYFLKTFGFLSRNRATKLHK